MPIDTAMIGRKQDPLTVTVERGRLRFFASVTGLEDPVYTDLDAARDAGHPDLLVPPTILFGLELDRPEPFAWMLELGIDLRFVLHGQQSFAYHEPMYAGDTLLLSPTIMDIYSKKGGALEFVVRRTDVTRDTQLVAVSEQTIVVRHPKVGP